MNLNVQLVHPASKLPTKNEGDLGWDLYCVQDEDFKPESYLHHNKSEVDLQYTLYPSERHLFSTGFKGQIPKGYGVLLKDRSGMAVKRGLHVLAGVIDSTYRGEWKICLINLGSQVQTIRPGDRIAQAIFIPMVDILPILVDKLNETDRGENGFGSSGK